MKVREMLSKALPSVSGLTSEEKDPEEILSHLFQRIFKAEPFIRQRYASYIVSDFNSFGFSYFF